MGQNPESCSNGSSPLARGGDGAAGDLDSPHRFIPACAGSRYRGCPTSLAPSVHPRSRGEQTHRDRRQRGGGGFIPACAGSSLRCRPPAPSAPVHPRLRGEQPFVVDGVGQASGSSPLARGAVGRRQPAKDLLRFIPACAGSRLPDLGRYSTSAQFDTCDKLTIATSCEHGERTCRTRAAGVTSLLGRAPCRA
ncbi:Domain of uncharacterised function (DUF2825) [Mycobacteroides abscessus subsp. abscessus]|nr:Domain of uncharacterised function (DUF2825) [Mycobacteroides abscessus subsp. abscessus]